MKKLCIILFIFLNKFLSAQEKPIIINGQITVDNETLNDIHIINKTLEIGTITNDEGFFEIPAKKGDMLIISHINLEVKEYTITKDDILNKKTNIILNNKTYVLNEIVIENKKGIFDVDKDIMPNNAPIVNAKTLNLPFAESEKGKENKLIEIEKGLTIDLGGFINVLNGTYKKKKELKTAKLEDYNLKNIRSFFTDSFFTNQLNIKKKHIYLFLNQNINSGIIQLYNTNKHLELTTVLLESSKSFSIKNTEDKTTISSKEF